jgi:hypothetical protein
LFLWQEYKKYKNMSAKLTSHSESPEISGLLYKKRGGFGKMMPNSWQYRLFILSKDGILTYYDTEVPENKDIFESKERGRIDLRGIKYELTNECADGAPPTQHVLVIQPEEGEKWKLCADTKEDHARWWKIIEKFMNVPKRDKELVKSSALTIQSDDDFDASKSKFERRGSASNVCRPSIYDSDTGSMPPTPLYGDTINPLFDSTPSRAGGSSGTSASASFADTAVLPAPVPSTAQQSTNSSMGSPHTHHHSKKKLRLARDTSMISQEWIEWILVLLIVNACCYGVVFALKVLDRLVYLTVLNGVVLHTLSLRTHRAEKAAATTASAATTDSTSAPTSMPGSRGTHVDQNFNVSSASLAGSNATGSTGTAENGGSGDKIAATFDTIAAAGASVAAAVAPSTAAVPSAAGGAGGNDAGGRPVSGNSSCAICTSYHACCVQIAFKYINIYICFWVCSRTHFHRCHAPTGAHRAEVVARPHVVQGRPPTVQRPNRPEL